jgi:hypothetical protein
VSSSSENEALFNVGGELGACLSFISFIASNTEGANTSTMKTNQKPSWLSLGPILSLVSYCCVASVIFSSITPALRAQAPSLPPTASDAALSSNASVTTTHSQDDWVSRWLQIVDKTRADQPHYVAPLITTHVLLVQQFRFDSYFQQAAGVWSQEYGAGKGWEIIPNTRMEVQVAIPPYFSHGASNVSDGFGDVSILLKFRAFSAPEGKGDYFVGLFLAGDFPSAAAPNGLGHTVWSPMIAAAKGWRFFDVQSTLSGNLPQSGTNVLGRQIVFNNAFQFKVANIFWPEVETNSTFFVDGPLLGNSETFLTPGLITGPFQIAERLHFAAGFGVQIAATHFHRYDHRLIWSMRFPF